MRVLGFTSVLLSCVVVSYSPTACIQPSQHLSIQFIKTDTFRIFTQNNEDQYVKLAVKEEGGKKH